MGLSFTHAVPQCRSRHRVGVPERVPSPLAASPQGLWLWWAAWGRDQGFKIFSVCANPLPGAQSCLGTGDLGLSSQGMGGGGWRGQDPSLHPHPMGLQMVGEMLREVLEPLTPRDGSGNRYGAR